jgi:hypothetical protein
VNVYVKNSGRALGLLDRSQRSPTTVEKTH